MAKLIYAIIIIKKMYLNNDADSYNVNQLNLKREKKGEKR